MFQFAVRPSMKICAIDATDEVIDVKLGYIDISVNKNKIKREISGKGHCSSYLCSPRIFKLQYE